MLLKILPLVLHMCLFVRYLAMDVLLPLRSNFGNVFIVTFPSTGHEADYVENTSLLLAACLFVVECQSYITIAGIPPITSSWRQAPSSSTTGNFLN
jgi:hypothetical protein